MRMPAETRENMVRADIVIRQAIDDVSSTVMFPSSPFPLI